MATRILKDDARWVDAFASKSLERLMQFQKHKAKENL